MSDPVHVLIVDDEPGVRLLLKETLEREGYQVRAVGSVEIAVSAIDQQEFDVALIDLMVGSASGLDVLKKIRERQPDTVLIVLTAHASLESAVEALRLGAHDYLFKPTKTIELRESVRRGLLAKQQQNQQVLLLQQLEQRLSSSLMEIRSAFETHSSGKPPETSLKRITADLIENVEGKQMDEGRFLKRGDLIVDLLRHVITLDGVLLELSPTEFDLLAYLISEAPRVVPAAELVREVQGYEGSDPRDASDITRYHVYRIRRKIKESTGRADIVTTVRGIGYSVKGL